MKPIHSVSGSFISIFLHITLLISCRSTQPNHLLEAKIKKDFNPKNQVVVFVPGIKGSRLVDKEGRTMWLTGWQALGFNTPNLHLSESNTSIQPKGAIQRVTAVPYLLDVEIYDSFLHNMSSLKGVDFYVFSYDWRKDNISTRKLLKNFLIEIGKKYKTKPLIIGHSMGGMLSFSVVNHNPNIVSGAFYVGVPFQGGIGYMKDLYKGVSTGLNSEIQSPCTIAKYESVYSFFPRLNSKDTQKVATDTNGKEVKIDFFSSESWKNNNLGFHNHTCKPDEIPNPLEFQRILTKAKLFRDSLDLTETTKKNSVPSFVVSANNRDTTRAMVKVQDSTGAGSNILWDMDVAKKVPGDGSVSEANSLPQKGFKYKLLYTEYQHSNMLSDPKIQEAILDFLHSSLSSGEQN